MMDENIGPSVGPGPSTSQLTDSLFDDIHDAEFLKNRRWIFEGTSIERGQALNYFRRFVTNNTDQHIRWIILAGLVPILLETLQKLDEPANQLEAAWVLINICAGNSDAAQHVVVAGAIPIFIRLLSTDNINLVYELLWALSNLAADSPTIRDTILAEGVVPLLVPIVSRSWATDGWQLKTYAWILTNFCGGEPLPDPYYVEPLLPVLKHMLLNSNQNDQTEKDACWALIYLAKQGSAMIDEILQTGIASIVVSLLSERFNNIGEAKMFHLKQLAAMRLIGDVLKGTEAQRQHMIDVGVIPALVHIATMNLPRQQRYIQREAYCALSKVTAGIEPQANTVFEVLVAHMPAIILVITDGRDGLLRRDALGMFANAFLTASWSHIYHLINEFQFIWVLCDVLRLRGMETLPITMEALHRLLTRTPREGDVAYLWRTFIEGGGFDLVEHLQQHPAVEVSEGSARILRAFAIDSDPEEGSSVES